MKIGILNIYSFPQGLAPTNRILAYAKGLVEAGSDCEIISIKPQVRTKENSNRTGIVNGAKYIHHIQIPATKNRILSSVLFRTGNIVCYWKSLWYIFRSKPKFDVIILSFDQPCLMLPVVLMLKLFNIKAVAIADEFPTPIRKKLKSKIPAWKSFAYKIISKSLSGRVLMTQKLADFYNSIKPLPTLILSTITDVDRFKDSSICQSASESPYLCYMGNMELSKDNVVNIIKAFHLIHPEYPEYRLYLYGAPSSADCSTIKHAISQLNLDEEVLLKGLATYEQVPHILSSAKILVTSQPDTKRAEGGFPTKMGEYMMTGVPCILTDVGEISDYVTNGETVYMVPPENPERYADMIKYVLDNYDEAKVVAQRAVTYIQDSFSSYAAGQKLNSFLMQLN